tara:strand:- start:1140 stop:2012 length:873 start_codon:yes stop_codon:yes gene_type:complete
MNFYKFTTLSLIFFVSFYSNAKNNNEAYSVEIVVFEQLEVIGNEQLESQKLNIEGINTITLQDKLEISLNEKSIINSFDFEENEFSVDIMPINESNTNNKESSRLTNIKTNSLIDENKWFEKKSKLDQLSNIYRRLDRRKEYKILHKESWIQPALSKENAPYIHEIFDNNGLLIKLYKSRYLHLDVIAYLEGDLSTNTDKKIINKIKLDALKDSIPDEIKDYDIKINTKIFKKDEIVKPKINTEEAFTEPLIRSDEVKYLLKEERRIFKDEVHYFDHPKIGIIISVYSSL